MEPNNVGKGNPPDFGLLKEEPYRVVYCVRINHIYERRKSLLGIICTVRKETRIESPLEAIDAGNHNTMFIGL